MKLTALRELEMTLGFSDGISALSTYTIEGTHSKHIQSGFRTNCIGISMYLSQFMHITRVFVSVHMDKSYGFFF